MGRNRRCEHAPDAAQRRSTVIINENGNWPGHNHVMSRPVFALLRKLTIPMDKKKAAGGCGAQAGASVAEESHG